MTIKKLDKFSKRKIRRLDQNEREKIIGNKKIDFGEIGLAREVSQWR
jgi:hypothetical protein